MKEPINKFKVTRDFYEYAFLSAYTNIPLCGLNPKDFFEKNIQPIFREESKEENKPQTSGSFANSINKLIKAYSDDDDNLDKKIYNPIAYCLFGEFDLAVFSLIDDFNFASRKFKPYDKGGLFKYQINTGVIPLIDQGEQGAGDLNEFKDSLDGLFSNGHEFIYPYVGITSIKLNNAMMVGIGDDFIKLMNQTIVTKLDQFIKQNDPTANFKSGKDNLFYVINENVGWNELTIYFFSKTTDLIKDAVYTLRGLNLSSISNLFVANNEFKTILNNIENNSLLTDLIGDNKESFHILTSHPIIATSTIFGFNVNLFDPVQADKFEQAERAKIKALFQSHSKPEQQKLILRNSFLTQSLKKQISISWNIKPGHEARFKEIVTPPKLFKDVFNHKNEFFDKDLYLTHKNIIDELLNEFDTDFPVIHGPRNDEFNIKAGKFSIMYPDDKLSLIDYLIFVKSLTADHNYYLRELKLNIIKFKSDIVFHDNEFFRFTEEFDPETHYEYDLSKFQISANQLEEIRKAFKKIPVSNLIEEQIENIIINFNQAVTDPLIYNYFIGLKESIFKILVKLEILPQSKLFETPVNESYSLFPRPDVSRLITAPNSVIEIPETAVISRIDIQTLLEFISHWDQAYWNRYFHSYYFTELSDFNIEHHGGVQQILFGYDIAYKIICDKLYSENHQFINVITNPTVNSDRFSVHLNLVHLFSPVIFAVECIHESANHYFQDVIRQNIKDPNAKMAIDSIFTPEEILHASESSYFDNSFYVNVVQKLKLKNLKVSKVFETYFGCNILRYLTTDYITYKLGYSTYKNERHPGTTENDLYAKHVFNVSHWLNTLSKTDYFEVLQTNDAEWVYREDAFISFFLRLNLMYSIFFLEESKEEGLSKEEANQKYYTDLKDMLLKFNHTCPSYVLKRYWDELKPELIETTLQLVKILNEELELINRKYKIEIDEHKISFKSLKYVIDNSLTLTAEDNYLEGLISLNHDLIRQYDDIFYLGRNETKLFNTVKRTFQSTENLSFYQKKTAPDKEEQVLDVLFDPRGGKLVLGTHRRKEVMKMNIQYMKSIFNISQQWVKKCYR